MITSMEKETKFYVVDFDRTLVDSDKLLEVFMEVADRYYKIPREQIEKADADVKARGDSFDTVTFVRDHLKAEDRSEEWEGLKKHYIHECRSFNMLLPGALELLGWLDKERERYGILTYGNPRWQRIKLSAAGFNHVPHIVMETKEKGRLIKSWQQQDGTFKIPNELNGGVAGTIEMIDDKAVSFHDFPDLPSKGYWVCDINNELPSQSGEIPSNVTRHNNLASVIKDLVQM